jgi:DNA-binding MarR family transcriptional regulator
MERITHKNAAQQDFMPVMRALVHCYQAFANADAAGHRLADLTPSQADVIFTLGNTPGLTFREIGELTLITKGTLTGVIDRLEQKQLVQRIQQHDDKRCTLVKLTRQGEQVFQRHFPAQIRYLKQRFDGLSGQEKNELTRLLEKLRGMF